MSETIFPTRSISSGSSPDSISFPNRLHKTLRKYSCLGKERKLLESVNIPTNVLINPIFERAFSCFSIPSFWSRNHHPEPNCTFPFTDPSLKFPIIVAIISLSAGFRL